MHRKWNYKWTHSTCRCRRIKKIKAQDIQVHKRSDLRYWLSFAKYQPILHSEWIYHTKSIFASLYSCRHFFHSRLYPLVSIFQHMCSGRLGAMSSSIRFLHERLSCVLSLLFRTSVCRFLHLSVLIFLNVHLLKVWLRCGSV